MFTVLLSGLRSLRVSLVTGALIVASVYVFLYDTFISTIELRTAALNLLEYSPLVPLILFVSFCLTVGSLYTTLLEGIIDSLHRKNVLREIGPESSKWERWIIAAFLPYSNSAKKRLVAELARHHREYLHGDNISAEGEQIFVEKVLVEVLWMEGKLAGTVLESPYDTIRSEGEMRIAGGLLFPLASTTVAYSIKLDTTHVFGSFLLGVAIAIPTLNYGLYYFRKANSFLAHHIADGTILSPSMESLRRTAYPVLKSNYSSNKEQL